MLCCQYLQLCILVLWFHILQSGLHWVHWAITMASKEHKISNHTVAGTTWDMIWTILDTLEIVRKPGSATSHSIIVHAGDKVVIMFLLKLCHLFDLLYLNSLVYIFMRIFMFLSCYYYWIFGSPHPTVCRLVFFHLHLASGLNLWKFPLAIMHLHFFVWRHPKTCTCYLIPSLPSFSQLKFEDHITWSLCLSHGVF